MQWHGTAKLKCVQIETDALNRQKAFKEAEPASEPTHQQTMLHRIDGTILQSEQDDEARRRKQAQFGQNQYFDANTVGHHSALT